MGLADALDRCPELAQGRGHLCPSPNAELREHRRHVVGHRLRREYEAIGNLGVREPHRQVPGDPAGDLEPKGFLGAGIELASTQ